jgi:hypothetical protein
MIYFIADLKAGLVKIGYSINPDNRLQQLQTGYPDKLYIICVEEGEYEKEAKYHNLYNEYKLYSKEWFKLEGRLKEYLMNNGLENYYHIKLFTNSVSKLHKLKGKEQNTFILLSTLLEYNTGKITINKEDRINMCEQLNISNTQFSNHLKSICELDLMKGSKGLYYINPEILWKGDINYVRKLYLNYYKQLK